MIYWQYVLLAALLPIAGFFLFADKTGRLASVGKVGFPAAGIVTLCYAMYLLAVR